MRQWMLRITAYAERLIDELEPLDWPAGIKLLQRNWIGKSEGAEVHFEVAQASSLHSPVDGKLEACATITVFTTRPDTLYGATYMVLSPENPLVDRLTTGEQQAAVREYREQVAAKSDLERTDLAKEKTGVFTGGFAINPASNERIPIWIADYVLMGYGTGAIMGVPAHDERDLEFATKFGLEIREVVRASQSATPADPGSAPGSGAGFGASPKQSFPSGTAPKKVREGEAPSPAREARALPNPESAAAIPSLPFLGEGVAINSPIIDGLTTPEAKDRITAWLEERGLGRRTINYKLRDWLFSRQRYWGEPFPIIWRDGKHEAIPESELPLVPPPLDDFKPTGTGEPPLARAREWVRYSDAATRELNTMPQWAGSCWYYLRFCEPGNKERFVGRDAERYWMSVDLYVGGTEHAVLHLLYARFWHKVLFDLGHLSTGEPFQRLVNQGIILGEDGRKMSKRWGNVIDPST